MAGTSSVIWEMPPSVGWKRDFQTRLWVTNGYEETRDHGVKLVELFGGDPSWVFIDDEDDLAKGATEDWYVPIRCSEGVERRDWQWWGGVPPFAAPVGPLAKTTSFLLHVYSEDPADQKNLEYAGTKGILCSVEQWRVNECWAAEAQGAIATAAWIAAAVCGAGWFTAWLAIGWVAIAVTATAIATYYFDHMRSTSFDRYYQHAFNPRRRTPRLRGMDELPEPVREVFEQSLNVLALRQGVEKSYWRCLSAMREGDETSAKLQRGHGKAMGEEMKGRIARMGEVIVAGRESLLKDSTRWAASGRTSGSPRGRGRRQLEASLKDLLRLNGVAEPVVDHLTQQSSNVGQQPGEIALEDTVADFVEGMTDAHRSSLDLMQGSAERIRVMEASGRASRKENMALVVETGIA